MYSKWGGLAADHRAERHQRIHVAAGGESVERGRYLPGTGHADEHDVVAPGAANQQELARALDEALDDAAVEARRHQPEPDAGRVGGGRHVGALIRIRGRPFDAGDGSDGSETG